MPLIKEEEDSKVPWPILQIEGLELWILGFFLRSRYSLFYNLFVIHITCLVIELYVNKLVLGRTT